MSEVFSIQFRAETISSASADDRLVVSITTKRLLAFCFPVCVKNVVPRGTDVRFEV